jgi:peroxiredoxin
MESARELKLGDVDEWTIRSINNVGQVTHPFHIHVNPFEVTSIMAPEPDGNGWTHLVEQLKNGPVWKDTVMIPGDGYVRMRTHYTDFVGTFVQHCHILDHEDQGMMELIDIYDKNPPTLTESLTGPSLNCAAPTFNLPNEDGKNCSLNIAKGKPVVLFFFKGHGCLHCSQQVASFTEHFKEFQRRGIQVIGVTSDSSVDLKTAIANAPCPFPILADPYGIAFSKFGCTGPAGLKHGTFALDSKHNVVWKKVGSTPYMVVTNLLKLPQLLQKASLTRKVAARTNHRGS